MTAWGGISAQSTLGIIICGVFLGLDGVIPFFIGGGIEWGQCWGICWSCFQLWPHSDGSALPPQVMGLVQHSGWDGVG